MSTSNPNSTGRIIMASLVGTSIAFYNFQIFSRKPRWYWA